MILLWRAPADHCGFYTSVGDDASPHAILPLAQERNDVRTDVIFAKDLKRPIGRRCSFMIELVDAFLPGDHRERLSIEQVSETGHNYYAWLKSTRRSPQWVSTTFAQSAISSLS
jgi:hypothetical protein